MCSRECTHGIGLRHTKADNAAVAFECFEQRLIQSIASGTCEPRTLIAVQPHLARCERCRAEVAKAAIVAQRRPSMRPATGILRLVLKCLAVLVSLAAIAAAWRYGHLLENPAISARHAQARSLSGVGASAPPADESPTQTRTPTPPVREALAKTGPGTD